MSVQICPVCGGKGLVPNGFYTAVGTPYYSTTNTSPETCRSCWGKGYIETYDGDAVTHDQYPCNPCNVGWGYISTIGTTSCHDCCLRPRNYRRYCTTKLVWAHANVPSELPEPTELRNKYSDSNYLVMAKVGFPNPQNQYEIYVLTSNDIWTKLDDFHDITTYKFEDEVIT